VVRCYVSANGDSVKSDRIKNAKKVPSDLIHHVVPFDGKTFPKETTSKLSGELVDKGSACVEE